MKYLSAIVTNATKNATIANKVAKSLAKNWKQWIVEFQKLTKIHSLMMNLSQLAVVSLTKTEMMSEESHQDSYARIKIELLEVSFSECFIPNYPHTKFNVQSGTLIDSFMCNITNIFKDLTLWEIHGHGLSCWVTNIMEIHISSNVLEPSSTKIPSSQLGYNIWSSQWPFLSNFWLIWPLMTSNDPQWPMIAHEISYKYPKHSWSLLSWMASRE